MRYLVLLIFIPPLLLGGLGAPFTWGKLNEMKQIRGLKPGAIVEAHTVSDKMTQQPSTYWMAWGGGDIRQRGNHRLNLPESVWNGYEIGDKIEIVYLQTNGTPYHQDGIYASDGNFVMDYIILSIELGMVAFAVLGAIVTFLFFQRSDRSQRTQAGRAEQIRL